MPANAVTIIGVHRIVHYPRSTQRHAKYMCIRKCGAFVSAKGLERMLNYGSVNVPTTEQYMQRKASAYFQKMANDLAAEMLTPEELYLLNEQDYREAMSADDFSIPQEARDFLAEQWSNLDCEEDGFYFAIKNHPFGQHLDNRFLNHRPEVENSEHSAKLYQDLIALLYKYMQVYDKPLTTYTDTIITMHYDFGKSYLDICQDLLELHPNF